MPRLPRLTPSRRHGPEGGGMPRMLLVAPSTRVPLAAGRAVTSYRPALHHPGPPRGRPYSADCPGFTAFSFPKATRQDLVSMPVAGPDSLNNHQRQATAALLSSLSPLIAEVGELFTAAGHEVALVGGPVRDAFLGRTAGDFDLTTDAPPERILEIIE